MKKTRAFTGPWGVPPSSRNLERVSFHDSLRLQVLLFLAKDHTNDEHLEEMGGNPFFYEQPTETDYNNIKDGRMQELLEMGGDPSFLTDDDEYDDDSLEDDNEMDSDPSEAFMAMAMAMSESSGGGDVMGMIGGIPNTVMGMIGEIPNNKVNNDNGHDDSNQKDRKTLEERTAETLDLGGDPFFLTNDDDADKEEDNQNDTKEDNVGLSAELMAMAMSTGGGVMGMIHQEKDDSKTIAKEDSKTREEQEAEILEMGGDPFFFTNDDTDEENNQDSPEENVVLSAEFLEMAMSASGGVMAMMNKKNEDSKEAAKQDRQTREEQETDILEVGGDPFFLTNDDDKEKTLPESLDTTSGLSAEFIAEAMSTGGGAMGILNQGNEVAMEENADKILEMGGDPSFLADNDSISIPAASLMETMTKLASMTDGEISQFEAIGGDPSFLLDDVNDVSGSFTENEDAKEWDGTVDEDAHLGFL